MLTPGIAGALTMMITNALGTHFDSPRAWTAIILSFAFGLLVLVADKRLEVRAFFYVLNSLVIFCVAAGANGLGVTHRASLAPISSAFAQGLQEPAVDSTLQSASSDQLVVSYSDHTSKFNDLTKRIANAKNNSTSKDEVIALIGERDQIAQQRRLIFRVLLSRDLSPAQQKKLGMNSREIELMKAVEELSKSIEELKNQTEEAGTNRFFKPWKF